MLRFALLLMMTAVQLEPLKDRLERVCDHRPIYQKLTGDIRLAAIAGCQNGFMEGAIWAQGKPASEFAAPKR